jgi:hypothetical protein
MVESSDDGDRHLEKPNLDFYEANG